MKCQIKYRNKQYEADLSKGIDLSLPLSEEAPQVNCYFAEKVTFETYRVGNFVGSVKEGGAVNYQKVTLTPHGNGTHTECLGHITGSGLTINKALKEFHFVAKLISVPVEKTANGDRVISLDSLAERLTDPVLPEALIIRTLPNDVDKKTLHYSDTNPPYLAPRAGNFLVQKGIRHLLIDLPSVDREKDEGRLAVHNAYWETQKSTLRTEATITELIFVPSEVKDGVYLLNLQIISLEMDASPSKPVLYALELTDR